MFSMQTAANAYAKVAVESKVTGANPHQLITLLYDGAIEALNQARMHIDSRQIEQKGRLINKAITIINEGLLASLNVDAGGELARNLAGLYDYMTFCLIAANRTNNRKSVDDVIKLLAELREAWIVIDPQKTAGTNSVSTAATLPRQFVYS
ncbi:MAG: flagellar export chaperone FliS [Burkholderiales bacterium]|jgi:flagellar protein FliS|nr:flagellar export chaperone FliS [Burkholderiales bacterium]MCA3162561.1 flagellar export chaperone FliS [Burkholderiales bacterium]MCA3163338.1 flagellar export chaperone FliS [Burkholderiales bacterium]MCA3166652.1 flagellar export chaperone FliS [Burkholderiales bacterium]MCA3170160.1 flagellar export chaperone FliS [Burkholderiales bacterium]